MIHNIVIFSYNRPRMVREAIESVLASRSVDLVCWVYDDGSDFDVSEIIRDIGDERVVLAIAPPMPPEERIRPGNTRWSTNINWILSKMKNGESITYLCDDDLLNPDWLSYAEDMLLKSKSTHIVMGDMYYFFDGDDPFTQSKKGFLANLEEQNEYTNWWNLGAFTHRTECFFECGVRWRKGHKDYPHSWDIQYIDYLLQHHVGYVKIPVPAMYRREHPNTLSSRAGRIEGGFYVRTAEELLPEHVSGFME